MKSLILRVKKLMKRNATIKEALRHIIAIFRKKSHRKMLNYINKNYKYLFEKYDRSVSSDKRPWDNGEYLVWVCWLQGYESMPYVIKLCYASLLKNVNKHKINFITMNNFSKFVNIPEYICEKWRRGIISPTHFSEILRASLLSKYGGLWLDASIYVSGRLPTFEDFSYWTTIMRKNDGRHTYSEFIAYCLPNDILWSSTRDFLIDYWKSNNKVIDYFILSIFMDCAYKNISVVKELIDKIPLSKRSVFNLYQLLNSEYNANEYKVLCDAICFHKLTYKEDFKKYTKDGKLTYYGYLMREWERDTKVR